MIHVRQIKNDLFHFLSSNRISSSSPPLITLSPFAWRFSLHMCISYLWKNIITTKLPNFTSKLFCFYWVKNELCKNLLINNSQQYVIIYLSASNVYFQNRSQILTNKLQIQFWFHYQKQIILLIISVPGIPIVINNLNICESK